MDYGTILTKCGYKVGKNRTTLSAVYQSGLSKRNIIFYCKRVQRKLKDRLLHICMNIFIYLYVYPAIILCAIEI